MAAKKKGKKTGGKKKAATQAKGRDGSTLHGAAKKAHAARLARGGAYKKKVSKPTKFQQFLMSNPSAAKKKMGWK